MPSKMTKLFNNAALAFFIALALFPVLTIATGGWVH